MQGTDPQYAITLITNENETSQRVVSRRKPANAAVLPDCDLRMSWPQDVYSLSHVALSFAPTDPLYGGPRATDTPGVQLGNLALRGERDVLRVSATTMLRQRWNPFYDYLAGRIQHFMGLTAADTTLCAGSSVRN